MNWQPIETAPKDGTRILAAGKTTYLEQWKSPYWQAVIMFYEEEGKWVDFPETYDGSSFNPTHWMPLPEPPAPQPAGEASTTEGGR